MQRKLVRNASWKLFETSLTSQCWSFWAFCILENASVDLIVKVMHFFLNLNIVLDGTQINDPRDTYQVDH